MTIPASSIPAAKLWIVQHIAAHLPTPNDPTVTISYDAPAAGTSFDDLIIVGRVERIVEPHAMVGSMQAGSLEEQYTVEVEVVVFRGGDQAQVVFERASALADAVVATVRTDPTLGGAVLLCRPGALLYESLWDDGHLGREATVTVPIFCRQVI